MRTLVSRLCLSRISRSASVTLVTLIALASSCGFCSDIHQAAMYGDLPRVKALLENNPDLVFSKDNDGSTPLHWAAYKNRKAMVELLLANKANVNAKDNNGETPLHLAAAEGYKDVVELLLAGNANVNVKDNDGWTPLHYAASKGRPEVVELLLANKADVKAKDNNGRTPLDLAAGSGQAAELLRSHGAKVAALIDMPSAQQKAPPSLPRSRGASSTHAPSTLAASEINDAAEQGDLGKVRALLRVNGALVFSKDDHGKTPLHWAAEDGHTDVAKLLLTNKAEVNAKDNNGMTPLYWAAEKGHKDIVELLLANGADVNASSNSGLTPLREATALGHEDIAKLLRTNGARTSTWWVALEQPELIGWHSFGASLASQADIDKLAQVPYRPPGARSSFGGFDPDAFSTSGYLGSGEALIIKTNRLFVAEDAVDAKGHPVGVSKFTLIDTEGVGSFPGAWRVSMSHERGERICHFSGSMGEAYLIRVGSEITLPSEGSLVVGGRHIRSGKIIVKQEGLEIEPGTESLLDDQPMKP